MKLGREINNVSSIRLGRVMITPAQLLFAFLLFVSLSDAWASCSTTYPYVSSATGQSSCGSGTYNLAYGCNGDKFLGGSFSVASCSGCVTPYICSDASQSRYVASLSCVKDDGASFCSYGTARIYASCELTICTTQCEADSIQCSQSDGLWNSDECTCELCDDKCQCEQQEGMVWNGTECVTDSSVCASLRRECQRAKGTFSGSGNSGCCIATCNQCGELTKLINFKTKVCCDQGLAPPDTARRCMVDARSTCGMNWSYVTSNDNEYQCQSPSLDSAASQRYASQCFGGDGDNGGGDGSSNSNGSSSSGGSSSSDEASSSSEDDGSSSSMDDEGETDCPECDKLDSVIDTLSAIHGSIEDIYFCLITPNECPGITYEDTLNFQFDTAWTFYIRPFLDTTLALDSAKLSAILKLDTHYVNQLKLDTLLLKNDTLTRTALKDFAQTNDTNLMRLREGVFSMDTAMKHHIDSLIRRIPDSVLDSIVKYQDSTLDRIDTAIFGKGKGFSLIDSLIDTTVKYFQRSNHYDSIYSVMFGDSISMLGENVRWLPSGIGYAMGYGDTATSTLRGDLNGIREAIEGLGDGLGGDIAGSLDSAIRSGGGADTSGVSYGWLEHGERLADSIKNSSGFGGLDFAGDSVMRDSLAGLGYSCDNDSCCVGSECIYFDSDAMIEDSLTRYVNRMGDSINQHNKDYLEDSTTTLFQEVKDSLTAFNPLGIFDSTLLSTLGAKIPNSNTCPDHCSKFEVDIPFSFGTKHFTIDYGLCLGRSVFGNGNILSFLRFIIRLIIAITCISAVMWNASRIRR